MAGNGIRIVTPDGELLAGHKLNDLRVTFVEAKPPGCNKVPSEVTAPKVGKGSIQLRHQCLIVSRPPIIEDIAAYAEIRRFIGIVNRDHQWPRFREQR